MRRAFSLFGLCFGLRAVALGSDAETGAKGTDEVTGIPEAAIQRDFRS